MPRTITELASDPSPESWRLLCTALDALPEPEALRTIDEIAPALDRWDEALRATMCGMKWDDLFFAGNPDPRSTIVRYLRFDRLFWGRYGGGFRIRSPSLGAAAMERLASSERVRWLTRLNFGSHPLGAAGARALAAGRHFESLRRLELSGCDLDGDALEALSRAPFYPGLRELVIGNNPFGGADVGALVASQETELGLLDVSSTALGFEGAAAIAAGAGRVGKLDVATAQLGPDGASLLAAWDRTLDALEIGGNGLGDGGLAQLVSGRLRARGLDVRGDSIGVAGIVALCRSRWPLASLSLVDNAIDDEAARVLGTEGPASLEELTLNDNDLTGAGLAAVLGSERLATLKSLSVAANRIGADGMRHLGPSMRTLERLGLADNRIEDEGVLCLAAAEGASLRHLDLTDNRMTARALEILTGAAWFGSLTSLDVSRNTLGPAAGVLIGAATLESLRLASCALGDDGAIALAANALRPKALVLDDCELGDRGVAALAASPILSRVETLWLSGNAITDAGVAALVRSAHLGALKELHIANNRIGDDGARALAGWEGPLAFHTDGNPIGKAGKAALAALPARCCP